MAGTDYGRQVHSQTGVPLKVSADGEPVWAPIGRTIDWATVAAVSGSDVTYPDGVVVKVGRKGLRLGQVMTQITASGKYGPYDPAAADGRQTLARDKWFILNESILETGMVPDLGTNRATNITGGIVGGLLWAARVLMTTGAASLAAGPTRASLEGVAPLIRWAE